MSTELRPNLIALNTIVYREVRRFMRIWQQGLRPDPHEAANFAVNDGIQRDQIGAQLRAHIATFARFFSTSDTNNSSRRLVLLRRLTTSMFCAAS